MQGDVWQEGGDGLREAQIMFGGMKSSGNTNMNDILNDVMSVEQLSMVSVAELQCNIDFDNTNDTNMKNEQKCGCDIGLSEGPRKKCSVCTVEKLYGVGEVGMVRVQQFWHPQE